MTLIDAVGDEAIRKFDWDPSEGASYAIVTAVAAEMDADPASLEPLHTSIDPDSLNSLFRPGKRSEPPVTGRIQFEYLGYWVVVTASGRGYLYGKLDRPAFEAPRQESTARTNHD